jgi:hypothetical protein
MYGESKYSISRFVLDAKKVLASDAALERKKGGIAERLQELSKRQDLLRFGLPIGPADGCTQNFLLWREPPHTMLALAQFDHGYESPVHEHGNFWVVCCGYRGEDRWDMYERFDDGAVAGHADVRMIGQIAVPPGKAVWMPEPPRAIHSHNNVFSGATYELVFAAAKPLPAADRLIYDVDARRCWPSPFNPASVAIGDTYPPRVTQRIAVLGDAARRVGGHFTGALRRPRAAFCPICITST